MLSTRGFQTHRIALWIAAVLFLSVLWPMNCVGQPGEQGRFRVITYNVLVGFGDHRVGDPFLPGAERKERAYEWLADEVPDVVAFQEMNGFTTESLATDASAWGHAHAALLKESGYDLGITAKYEIEVIERHTEGMHHGLLHCRTGGIDFVVVHLWPFKGDEQRLREVEQILARVERIEAEGRPCVVLGDFNAVSRLDDRLIGADSLSWYERWNWEVDEKGRPNYDVMDAVMEGGLVDVWAEHRTDDTPEFPARPRIDFIFASPDLAKLCTGSRWISTEEKHRVSDHPPVVADFDRTPNDAPSESR